MRNIVLSVLVCALTAIAAPAQIMVAGGGAPVGIPTGATIWYGTAAPLNTVGADGDYYLNTSSYCLYGPRASGAWPTACVSSVHQIGYLAENVGNKGTAGGYAPLDAKALVPVANLPPIAAINGTSVPSNNASDQTVVTTAPSVGAWTALPSCPDTGGNHLNYSLVTHGFLCGNTGGSVGSVSFGGVGSGTNANALLIGGSLSYTGGGQVNANQLSGVPLAGLSTGLLKITTGTGAPGIATSADVTGTLGFTPENSAKKGATNGYAPLNASSAVPLANLPAIPYSQTSGVQASLGYTAENAANKGASGGYAGLDSSAHLAPGQMPALTGDVSSSGVSATVTGLQGRAVASTVPASNQVLQWNGSQWAPGTVSGGGAVSSVFGRTGAVTAATGDYSFGQISGVAAPPQLPGAAAWSGTLGNFTIGPGAGGSGNGSNNVGVGYGNLTANTTGYQNIAIGQNALAANTTGNQNVAIGSLAMVANTTGSYNTAVGENALGNNTSGYDNFAFGLRALYQNTTGYNNSAYGIDSVGINTTGYHNSGFGTDSCAWNVTGYEDSCMGMNTLWSLTTGYDNAAMGFNAMFGATSGHYLTGLGAYADMYYPNTSAGVTLTATSNTANLSVGWYWYKLSFVLNGQETALSNNSYLGVLTDAVHKEVTIAGLPTYSGPFTASARRIYRTVVCPTTICTVITANQMPRHWYYVATISDNNTTTYVDSTADGSLGSEESSTPSKSVALGAYATVYGSYQMVVGSDPSPIQQIWLGNGMVTATAPAGVLVSSSGASGTNVAGQDFILAGGPGTGTANGGNVIFGTVPGGASGSVWNTLVNRWKIDGATGNLVGLSTGGITGVLGTVDFSGGAHTSPAKAGLGANKPATCAVGEQYFATDAAAGQNLFGCTAANTWTLEAGGGAAVSSVFGRTGAVTAQNGDYNTTQVTEGANLYFTNARAAAAAPVPSVFGRTGAVTAQSGDYNTTQVTEGANLYFTNARAAAAAPVPSVFGRTGAVTAQSGDYNTTQVAEGANLYFTNARAAAAAPVPSVFGRTGAVTAQSGDYTLTQIGAGTLSATGGTIYNGTAGQSTQLVVQNGPNQAMSGTASMLWKNNAGSNIAFINWDGGYAEGDGTNYKISLDTTTLGMSSDSLVLWHSANNVFSGTLDTGLARESAGIVKVTNGASGYGILDAGGLKINGTSLATVATSGSYTDLINPPTLAGDVTGGIGANTVAKIQSRAVASTVPLDGQHLVWSASNSQWQPTTVSSGAVASVFGRTGAVTGQAGDYTAAQVTNALDATQTYANPAWLTAVTFGGTNINPAGGTVYNNGGGGSTQLVVKAGANQTTSGTALILFKNNAGGNIGFINWDGGYASGDGTNYKYLFSGSTLGTSSDAVWNWKNNNSVFSGSYDVGLARESAGIVKVTNGSSGYGAVDAGGYSALGTAGVTSTTCTQWTSGLCTHN